MRAELIRPLPELLRLRAETIGDRVAFADATREVTYRSLDQRVRSLAGLLAIAPGDRVAILLGNTVAAVESGLAVVVAGGISVPLNPWSGDADLRHFLVDSGAAVVITDEAHRERVDRVVDPGVRVLDVGDFDSPDSAGDFGSLDLSWNVDSPGLSGGFDSVDLSGDSGSSLDGPAILLYTSGTTALPKGVLYSLRSTLWMAAACHVPILGLSSEDTVLWPLPLFHGLGQNLGVFGAVAAGATVRILSGFSPAEVLGALREYDATVLAGVPTTYHHLLSSADAEAFPALRLGFVAGSASGAALGERFEAAFGVPLVDQYGSTETAAITTNWPAGQRVPGSAGLPVPGVSVRLVDPLTGREALPGEEGEVWVSGPNLMLGYHNQPDATAEALRDGWYHTGDLARRDSAGFVTITGRLKELIIRGGENIHPAEVENVLRQVPGIADVAVGGKPDEVLGEVPVAWVVPGPDGFDAEALLDLCRRELAYYKVPAEVYETAEIPRTQSGKVARHRLGGLPARLVAAAPAVPLVQAGGGVAGATALAGDGAAESAARTGRSAADATAESDLAVVPHGRDEAGATYLDPAAVLTLILAETAALLGTDEVAPDRPFVELGLGSMAVVTLTERLISATGVRLSPTAAFDHPTPQALARRIVAGEQPAPVARKVRRQAADDDPIAIVAMACRYPGGITSPEDFWELLAEGRDAIVPFPADRGWDLDGLHHPDPEHTGTTYTLEGGFLTDVAGFDAEFFGISPKEATAMDPQQRLTLETSWDLLERAGIDVTSLHGSITGVFMGVQGGDYQHLGRGLGEYEAQLGFATSASVLSGRVAYSYGLEGPAITVDAACSASLVAIHLACQSLRSGESELAIAGGVTVMSTPDSIVTFARQRGLAADSRCKTFSADSDGTSFGEGIGMVLLERLSDARRNGHQALAVVRSTAVNQDGASNGLTAPNGLAQQRVIRQALANGGLTAAHVDLVEAHGTGTTLGDPIEAQAILATYGQDRTEPAWLGAVKSNFGHTQAAAGIAGVIKSVQAIRHGVMPRTLHVAEPTPHVDWTSGEVRLLTEAREWPSNGNRRRAGISAFAISGTNAHVIVEEVPAVIENAPSPREHGPLPWLLSARSVGALRDQALRLAETDAPAGDIAYSLATTRAALPHRAAVVADSIEGFRAALADLSPEVAAGRTTAFLFTGQGSQRMGMGKQLHDRFPVFAAAFDDIAGYFDQPLRQILLGDGDPELVNRTDHAQPALFAFEVALFRLLEHWGVRPDVLAGHSIGELAAAHVAGVFSLADAAALVSARGTLMHGLPGRGAMYALELTEDDARELLAGEEQADIAAINGPRSVVVSGDEAVVARIADVARERGVRTKRLIVSHAFHSPLMEGMLDDFRSVAAGLSYHAPRIPLVSTVTGDTGAPWTDPEYWVGQVRAGVRFAPAVNTLRALGVDTFLEVGPDAVLTALVGDSGALSTVRRNKSEVDTLVTALSKLHNRGVAVDWRRFFAGSGARAVALPTYSFQHRRYWLDRVPVAHVEAPEAAPAPVLDLTGVTDEEEQFAAVFDVVAAAVARVLGYQDPAEIDPDMVIANLGLDSLAAVDLRNELADRTGLELRATVALEHPTLAVLTDELATRLLADAKAGPDAIDFAAEVTLAADIVPAARVETVVSDPEHVFLTGVTGFLGAFLLRDLLQKTTATVHCLVRAKDAADGLERVRTNLDWYGIEAGLDRLVVVPGDLAAPRLGLDEETFDHLARTVDVVYHAAAQVNGIYPYSALKPANVSGTEEILRLAATHRTVPLHHVSTTGVFSGQLKPGVPLATSDVTGPPEKLWSGYRQSKWVAEQLIGLAVERGLPVSIYRVDEISGTQDTGACQQHDFVWLAVKGLLQACAAPAGSKGDFHLVPVDYVSAAVVELSRRKQGTYHLGNRTHLPFAAMLDSLRGLGYPLSELDWDDWAAAIRSDQDNAMNSMLAAFETTIHTADNAYVTIGLDDTEQALAGSGVVCPPMTRELFEKYVRWFASVGYFPAPQVERTGLVVRPARLADLEPLARICFSSFNELNQSLNLPPEWETLDQAREVIRERLTSPACVTLVAVDDDGAVLGSNFVLPGDEVATWGPLSVDPLAQGRGVARRLMAATIEAIEATGRKSAHVVQTAANLPVYRLYTSAGCAASDELAVLRGRIHDPVALEGFTVRPLEVADIDECRQLHREVVGYSRDTEIALAARGGFGGIDPYVVIEAGRIVGYTTGLTFMGHLACESEAAARALVAGVSEASAQPPLLRVMSRLNPEFLTWALHSRDVGISRLETIMSYGAYRQPLGGVYCPAQSH
ncbi:thioester reductase domain-containing protein [Lentzea sp. NPDC051213]|uniref:thioester reductase domain-containing protein n=1 Tax=Lentzea sp. NPDC051213 TaxID=3364126 RepID=UPI0037AAE94B